MAVFTGAPMENQFDISHWTGHILSLAAILATFAGWLPAIAALAGLIWYLIQIWESETTRSYIDRWRTKRKIKRIARLLAEHKILIAELDALSTVREARVLAADKLAVAAAEARKQLAVDNNSRLVAEQLDQTVKSTPEAKSADVV